MAKSASKLQAIIFDIQRFSIHDGPGIRTLIFMKGCPLQCLWCCNPEGQHFEPNLIFIERLCISCKRCVRVCPENASTVLGNRVKWDTEKCRECMKCVEVCPSKARQVRGEKFTVEQVLDEIEKDRAYYRRSGGGITIGGGDPLGQPRFTKELLKEAKNRGLHTAIETSGYGEWEHLKGLIEYLDISFIDIKQMDPEKHRQLTGKSNELILENITKASVLIASGKKEIIIRIPVVPGCNDSEENIRATADFVKKLGNIKRLELLPYHRMGEMKYNRLKWSKAYPLQGCQPPGDEQLLRLRNIVESCGLRAS